MSVVLDANLLVVLALDDKRAPVVEAKMREWATAGETTHAPALLPYEAANALLRAVVAGSLQPAVVTEIWATISAVPVTLHPLEAGAEVIAIAQRLGRQSAYDAAYVALALRGSEAGVGREDRSRAVWSGRCGERFRARELVRVRRSAPHEKALYSPATLDRSAGFDTAVSSVAGSHPPRLERRILRGGPSAPA